MGCGKCESYVPDPCSSGKTGTSQIVYDGPSLPGICIQPGWPLNKVLKTLDEAYIRLSQATAEMKAEVFTEFSHEDGLYVTLSSVPYNILTVSYCGGVVPVNGYILTGKKLKMNANYCFLDGNELRVVYMKKFTGDCANI